MKDNEGKSIPVGKITKNGALPKYQVHFKMGTASDELSIVLSHRPSRRDYIELSISYMV